MGCILEDVKPTTTTLLKCCHLKAKMKYNCRDVFLKQNKTPKKEQMGNGSQPRKSGKQNTSLQTFCLDILF